MFPLGEALSALYRSVHTSLKYKIFYKACRLRTFGGSSALLELAYFTSADWMGFNRMYGSQAKPCNLHRAAQQNETEDMPATLLQEALGLLVQHLQQVKYQPSSACRPASEASLSSYPAAAQLPELPLPSSDAQQSVRCNATDEAAAEQTSSQAAGSINEIRGSEGADESVSLPDSSVLSRVRITGASSSLLFSYYALCTSLKLSG